MRAPTVGYRPDEILKGIRHCRSSMVVSFHSSTEPGVIGRSLKIFILPQPSFFSFLVVASLTRYRHWLSESPLYLHVNETMPYLPYPPEPDLLNFLTRFCFFFFLSSISLTRLYQILLDLVSLMSQINPVSKCNVSNVISQCSWKYVR